MKALAFDAMQDDLPRGLRPEIDNRLALVATGENGESDKNAYWLAVSARGLINQSITQSLLACELDQLWFDLEDLYELWPDKRDEAQELMRRAAAEWSAVSGDSALAAYFDRWDQQVYETLQVWGPSPLLPPKPGSVWPVSPQPREPTRR